MRTYTRLAQGSATLQEFHHGGAMACAAAELRPTKSSTKGQEEGLKLTGAQVEAGVLRAG